MNDFIVLNHAMLDYPVVLGDFFNTLNGFHPDFSQFSVFKNRLKHDSMTSEIFLSNMQLAA